MVMTFLRDRRKLAGLSLIVALVFLVGVNALSNNTLRRTAIDLTAERVFTLSPGTINVLENMKEPVTLRFFVSPKLIEEVPTYGAYAQRVRDMLQRYAQIARGKIKLEMYEPKPFSPDEDRAVAYGLKGIPVDRSGEQVFFGLAASNSVDDQDKIAFFHPTRERYIEYDLTRMIYALSTPKKKVVGLLSSLPLQGQFYGARGTQPPWAVAEEIGSIFEIKNIARNATEIPKDVDVLLIVHPLGLSDQALYAIDQYVLAGGKAVVMVDPVPEAAPRRRSMFGLSPVGPPSNMPKLFNAWGIKIIDGKVAADTETALRVRAKYQGRDVVAPYVGWLQLTDGNINRTDPVTAGLSRVIIATAGAIEPLKGATTKITPLLSTSAKASLVDGNKFRLQPNVVELYQGYTAGKTALPIAVRITGPVKSAFPDGPPKAKDAKKDEKKDAKPAAPLKESKQPINVIVVADIDFLQEEFWSNTQNFFGEKLQLPTAGNADFVINALDTLSGANKLLGLRGKGAAQRPFTLVAEIEKVSQDRFRAKQAELVKSLEDTRTKLKDARTNSRDGQLILTKEQQAAIEKFQAEVLRIRRDLRAVRLNMRQDIEKLEARLKFINIGLIPVGVAFIAVLIGFVRYRRRRRRYETS